MSLPDPMELHGAHTRELTMLLDAVLAGDLVKDRAAVERRVVRSLGALAWLQRRHRIDGHGRCPICRSARRT